LRILTIVQHKRKGEAGHPEQNGKGLKRIKGRGEI